jgi:hypothetical protein
MISPRQIFYKIFFTECKKNSDRRYNFFGGAGGLLQSFGGFNLSLFGKIRWVL